jgi:hypothetical protein
MASDNPKLFISYSHDSEDHKKKVAALAQRLRQDGCHTEIDGYVNGTPDEGWCRWMMNQLDIATHVLVVCTENHYLGFRGHRAAGLGRGSDFEGCLITAEIYDSKSRGTKFVPVLFDPNDEKHIPEPLKSTTHYVLNSENNYQALLDFVYDASGIKPAPLGQRQNRTQKQVDPLSFPTQGAIQSKSYAANYDQLEKIRISPTVEIEGPAANEVPDSDDEHRKILIAAAVKELAASTDGLQALAEQLQLPDHHPADTRAQEAIEKLLKGNGLREVLTPLLKAIQALEKAKGKKAGEVLCKVAYNVIPAALVGDQIKQMTMLMQNTAGVFGFSARTHTFVEVAVARLQGRATHFREMKNHQEFPSAMFRLSESPEEGIDSDDEKFITNFIEGISKSFSTDLLSPEGRAAKIDAINEELETRFQLDRWQYYYSFSNPADESGRVRRRALAERMDKLFPRISFIALDAPESHGDENTLLSLLRRILAHAAGIEIPP